MLTTVRLAFSSSYTGTSYVENHFTGKYILQWYFLFIVDFGFQRRVLLFYCSCSCKMNNSVNDDLAAQLKTSQIRCSNLVYGCHTILPYEEIPQHELLCTYKPKISFPDMIFSSIIQDPSFHKRNSQSQGLQNFDNLFESHDTSTTHSEGNRSDEVSSSTPLIQE